MIQTSRNALDVTDFDVFYLSDSQIPQKHLMCRIFRILSGADTELNINTGNISDRIFE